jgi:hypothetical protein
LGDEEKNRLKGKFIWERKKKKDCNKEKTQFSVSSKKHIGMCPTAALKHFAAMQRLVNYWYAINVYI